MSSVVTQGITYRVNFNTGGLGQSQELVGRDFNLSISKNKSGVRDGGFGRHFCVNNDMACRTVKVREGKGKKRDEKVEKNSARVIA